MLITSCAGPVLTGPTITPDPQLMDVYERTIWDIENLRNQVNDLEIIASETQAEDLEPIIQELISLKEKIRGYSYPLTAAQAHSALYNFAFYTEQCYFSKYAELLLESSNQETIRKPEDDPCVHIQVYRETLNQYLQELKEMEVDS
jgi:hypothetical protein